MIWLTAWAYPGLKTATLDALAEHVQSPDIVRLQHAESAYAYGQFLRESWESGLDFAVVEHDIVIRADVVQAFHECEHDYCCFPYPWLTCVGPALGCTRFRASFTERYPDAMQLALDAPSAYGDPGHWKQLDVFLMRRVLRDLYGEQPHVHLPQVEHLNPDRALAADASPEPVLTVEGFA